MGAIENKTYKAPGGKPLRTVEASILEPIPYEYAGSDIIIHISQPEFTSVCPMTGLPDFGEIEISYCPDKVIIELKSLKYYFLQYRNVGVFYEHLVNKIKDDLYNALSPRWIRVTGNFSARGGISTRVVSSEGKKPKGDDE